MDVSNNTCIGSCNCNRTIISYCNFFISFKISDKSRDTCNFNYIICLEIMEWEILEDDPISGMNNWAISKSYLITFDFTNLWTKYPRNFCISSLTTSSSIVKD